MEVRVRRGKRCTLLGSGLKRVREGRGGEVDSERKGRREAFTEPEPEEQTEKENNLYFPPAFCLQPVRAVELTGG